MIDVERLALAVQLPGFAASRLNREQAVLVEQGLGGLCLFASNAGPGLPGLVAQLRAHGPVVVAVDEEGGDVTRLHTETGSPLLGPAALGAVDDLTLTHRTAGAMGAELAAAGINLDLCPVADVNSDLDNPVIGVRSFGSDPALVARHVAAYVSGLQASGVAACAKHFPGHGDTRDDSHVSLPTVDAPMAVLRDRELLPFAAAVEAGAAAVMTSHLLVPALDRDRPATFSPAVLGLLRAGLGFDGVILSDALDMAGASADRGVPAAAVHALVAGVDLLCLGNGKDVSLVRAVQSAVVDAVRTGALPEDRLVEAAGRVGALARRTTAATPPRDDLDDDQLAGARSALRVEGSLPRLDGALVAKVDTPASIAVGEVAWGLPGSHVVDPDDPRAVESLTAAAAERPLVLQVRDGHRHPVVAQLLGTLSGRPRPLVVVEWGWPAPSPAPVRICTHGTSQPAVRAVAEVLAKQGWAP
jgi:beta-N-acetylhexosaminidase